MVFLCVVVCSTRTWWACRCNSFVDFHEHKEQCKIEKWQSLRKREREREREMSFSKRWVATLYYGGWVSLLMRLLSLSLSLVINLLVLCIIVFHFVPSYVFSIELSLSLYQKKTWKLLHHFTSIYPSNYDLFALSQKKKKKNYDLFANYVQNCVQMLHLLNSLFNLLVDRFIDILMIASITIHRWGWTRKPCM